MKRVKYEFSLTVAIILKLIALLITLYFFSEIYDGLSNEYVFRRGNKYLLLNEPFKFYLETFENFGYGIISLYSAVWGIKVKKKSKKLIQKDTSDK